MGMFDYITYNGHKYQTKDTAAQSIDNYRILDNQLWYEEYDSEWVNAETRFGGYIEKKNPRWVICENFTGEVVFYRHLDKEYKVWETYSAYFHKGQLKELHLLEHEWYI